MANKVSVNSVRAIIEAIEPNAIGFRWELFGDGLDAAESYGVLSIIRKSHIMDVDEVRAADYERWSLPHATIEMLQNVLYNDGWSSVTIH